MQLLAQNQNNTSTVLNFKYSQICNDRTLMRLDFFSHWNVLKNVRSKPRNNVDFETETSHT